MVSTFDSHSQPHLLLHIKNCPFFSGWLGKGDKLCKTVSSVSTLVKQSIVDIKAGKIDCAGDTLETILLLFGEHERLKSNE